MRRVDVRDIPRLIRAEPWHIQVAKVKTLNTIAFDSLKPSVNRAKSDMSFSFNARRALGLQVEKASFKKDESAVFTRRKWFKYHSSRGTRTPGNRGWKGLDSRNYLLIPKELRAFNRRKKLKAGFLKNAFPIPAKNGGYYLMYRAKRGKKQTIVLGVLVPRAKHSVSTNPGKILREVFVTNSHRLFSWHLDNLRGR